MNYRSALCACAALFGFAATAFAGPASSQSVEDFYRGKALTLVVSADAGTPTDIIARQFSRFFVKYVPGGDIFFQVFESNWRIPNGTTIPVSLIFDRGTPWTATARGLTSGEGNSSVG